MSWRLKVSKFKSIREAEIYLRKVNVLIGPPEAGKSNLLESISLFTLIGQLDTYLSSKLVTTTEYEGKIILSNLLEIVKKMLRVERLIDPFFLYSVDEPVHVRLDKGYDSFEAIISYESDRLVFSYGTSGGESVELSIKGRDTLSTVEIDREELKLARDLSEKLSNIKFYRFIIPSKEVSWGKDLIPPDGPNLLHLLKVREGLREVVGSLLSDVELSLVRERPDMRVKFQRFIGKGEVIDIPLYMLSDTIKRQIFCLAAVETNKSSIIAMEEPEVHTFPFYVNFLAERIALDPSNTYLITTHSPYMLETLLNKVPDRDLAILFVASHRGTSKFKKIDLGEARELLRKGADLFFELGADQ